MFNRRKRSSSHNQPLSSRESYSAQSAATHAFLHSQPSSSSLSSAAAATALRTLAPPPTSVENVQTKRMIHRRASSQSQAGPLAARRSMSSDPQALRRRSSSSSMTSRTFREPSPHRPSTSSGPLDTTPVDVPPLPSLPSQYANRKLPPRRATSMQPQMRSPPTTPPPSTARGTSLDRVREGTGTSGVQSAHQRLSSLSTVQEIERPASRSSINFSRPISPTSPTESKPMGFPAAVREEPAQPVSTRTRMHTANSSESRTPIRSSGLAIGTAVAAAQAVIMQNASLRAEPAQARVERMDSEPLDISEQGPVDHTLPTTLRSKSQHPPSRATPEQWPSTSVVIEPEPANNVRISQPRETNKRVISASPTANHVEPPITPQPSPKAGSGPSPQQQAQLRQPSSPGRSARFSKWLSVSPSGDQVHQPPPRSVSPVKSALKQPRGSSLSPDRHVGFADRVVQPPSEISDGTSVASDEGSRNPMRRKPVKVSFDDEAEVVGVAASPPTSPEEFVPDSPQSKSKFRMNWLGFGRKKPSDFSSADDDFDEVMKPRPELPSFGSVRGNRDGGPKPPVPEFSDNESSASSDEGVSETRGIAISGDLALASMPANSQDSQPPQAHGIKSVEQLPVDGGVAPVQQESTSGATMDAVAASALTEQQPYAGEDTQTVPSIAVEPATPSVEERSSFDTTRSSTERYRAIPGGFPASNSDQSQKSIADQSVASAVPKVGNTEGEEESDEDEYDDAPDHIDGDGFGSINAIVDSQSIPRSSAPLATINESVETPPQAAGQAAAVDTQSQDVTDQAARDERSVTPINALTNPQVTDSPSSVNQPRSGAVSPPVPVKSAARGSPTPNGATQLETTKQRPAVSVDLYAPPSPQGSRQPKQVNGSATGKARNRPISLGPAFQMTRQSGFPNPLRRTTSTGSDSDSSFKRSTPSPRGDLHAMRRTMRSQSSTNERHSFFSSKKAQAARSRFSKGPKATKGSRFADSDDDDDDARPQVFRSRFADSSDEDEPGSSTLRPVRGIPRRRDADDGDSTELEDSSEEDHRQPPPRPMISPPVTITPPTSRGRDAQPSMSGMAAVARQRGMTQRELEEFLMQAPRGRASGFLARLGIKKPKNPDNRVRKADFESPSRRDTPLERSRLEREQLREENYEPSGSPKLRKKNKRFTIAGDVWPLRSAPVEANPAPVADEIHSAPTSPVQELSAPANGTAPNGGILVNGESSVRPGKESEAPHTGPDFNDAGSDITNTTNNEEVGPSARDVVIAGSGRKKGRFSLLRKAFSRKN